MKQTFPDMFSCFKHVAALMNLISTEIKRFNLMNCLTAKSKANITYGIH